MAINVIFNSRSLQSTIQTAEDIDHLSATEKDISIQDLTRADGSKITNQRFKAKTIPVPGKLMGTSVADLEAKIEQLKSDLYGVDTANLDIDYNSGTRRYVATCNGLTLKRVGGGTAAGYTAEFLVPSGMGQDTASTTVSGLSGAKTTSPSNNSITLGGTAPKQQLVITCVVTSFTGSTVNSITFTNTATGQAITITRTWTAADSLVIDVVNQTCKVNGTIVDFSGVFPIFAPGSQTLAYSDDFTARSVTLSATYNKRYL